jgi:sulfofructose kinase
MSGVVLCVGALSLDTIFRFDTLPNGPGKYLPSEALDVAQGMATAQAASIVRLGGKARLWASCGDDANGDRIAAQLADAGIDLLALRRVPGARSGFSSIFMDAAGERMIVPFYDPAIRTPPAALPPMDDVAVVSVDARWPDAAAMALRAASERGIPGVLDADVAPAETLTRLAGLASHVVASETVCAALFGVDDPVRALASAGDRFAAITCGERGCYWSAGESVHHLPAFAVEAVDTLAAGDVFHGAFASGLAEGWDIERNLRFAAAAAALNCTRFGGRLGAPTRAEVEAIL